MKKASPAFLTRAPARKILLKTMAQRKLLVSACLVGAKVRYDGRAKLFEHAALNQWISEGRVVSLCPEVEGGLTVPRPPAEQVGKKQIATADGTDLTAAFDKGARKALAVAQAEGCTLALLTDRSPSCGVTQVYTGQFDGSLRPGEGVTAALLRENGIDVYSPAQFSALAARMA